MFWIPSSGRSLMLVAVAVIAAFSGCSTHDDTKPPKVELSDGAVTISDPQTAAASVRYRVIQGRPRAGQSYKLMVLVEAKGNNRGYDLYKGDASGLSTGGTFQKECTIDPPGKAWTPGETVKYKFLMYEESPKGNQGYIISNRIDGEAQVP